MEDLKKTLKHMLEGPLAGTSEGDENQNPAEADISPDGGSESQVCRQCFGRGFIITSDDVAVRCSCMDLQQMANRFKSARLSRELRECRFDSFDLSFYEKDRNTVRRTEHLASARKALQAARGFVEGVLQDPHYVGLLYQGQAGSGKTFLAAAIANELIRHKQNVLFVVVPDLLDELRATYDRKDVSEYDLLDMAKTIPILILDDLGAHNYTDWTRNRIYSILNHRVNEKLPLIVTTNLHQMEISQCLGERTASRLLQLCRLFQLSVPQDIRRQKYQLREKQDKL